jgi:hypothetical protein
MRAEIDYDAALQRISIYMGGDGYGVYRDEEGIQRIQMLRLGDERRPFLTLQREEYDSIADAILVRESPRHADPALLREMLDDTRETRDRVRTMLERG